MLRIIYALGVIICLSYGAISFGQSRFFLEPEAGYQYANLNQFNSEILSNDFSQVKLDDLHHGLHLTMNVGYQFNHLWEVAAFFQYQNFQTKNLKENLSFEDPMPGGPNYTYSLRRRVALQNYLIGFRTSVSTVKLLRKKEEVPPLDVAAELALGYYWGRYHNDRITYMWNQLDNPNLSRDSLSYSGISIRPSLALKWAINRSWLSELTLRGGLNLSTRPIFEQTIYDEGAAYLNEVPVNFNGFFFSVAIRTYFQRKE